MWLLHFLQGWSASSVIIGTVKLAGDTMGVEWYSAFCHSGVATPAQCQCIILIGK